MLSPVSRRSYDVVEPLLLSVVRRWGTRSSSFQPLPRFPFVYSALGQMNGVDAGDWSMYELVSPLQPPQPMVIWSGATAATGAAVVASIPSSSPTTARSDTSFLVNVFLPVTVAVAVQGLPRYPGRRLNRRRWATWPHAANPLFAGAPPLI